MDLEILRVPVLIVCLFGLGFSFGYRQGRDSAVDDCVKRIDAILKGGHHG